MRILVTGAAGFFGFNFCSRQAGRFELITTWHRTRPAAPGAETIMTELCDPHTVDRLWAHTRPDAILHLAGLTSIRECQERPEEAEAVNLVATRQLAEMAAADGVRMLFTSTDLVFDGTRAPYRETDAPRPLFDYARTKAAAEQAVLEAGDRHLVCRVSLCYGPLPDGRGRQSAWMIAAAQAGQPITLYDDEFRTPIDSLTLADCLAELIEGQTAGLLHLGGLERWNRLDFGRRLLAQSGHDPALAQPGSLRTSGALRPADVSLDVSRASQLLKTPLLGLEAGLARCSDSSLQP